MVLEILCVEPIYPQYSGVLETCLALRYWFFEVLGGESVKLFEHYSYTITIHVQNHGVTKTFIQLQNKHAHSVMFVIYL